MSSATVIEAIDLCFFKAGQKILENVTFQIRRGELAGVIGPNGAGKTTLFNLISGALPLTSGEINFKGERISGLKPHQICRKGISRTFQLVKVFGNMSVLQNVMMGVLFGKNKAVSPAEAEKDAMEALEFVGLLDHINTPAKDLIVGNQKRLEVARALATKPELLMLDELMAGLNPAEVAEASEDVLKLKEKGMTIIMIEHVMKAIMSLCDRIVVLHHGEKIAEGTPKEVCNSSKVIEVYLGE